MSSMRQQWSAKKLFCKQKSIDDKSESSDSHNNGKRILRKQLSVDHLPSSLKHASKSGAPINFNNLLWQDTEEEEEINEPNLRTETASAIKKRAQFAAICANNSINNAASETPSATTTLTVAKKDKININIFLSQDLHDDGCSDNEAATQNNVHKPSSSATTTTTTITSSSSSTNISLKSSAVGGNSNSEANSAAINGRLLSASTRRAQFQSSRRIMSAPIRPALIDDSKNKRKGRKKKVIRVNLTLNRDKDIDESPDEFAEELEEMKQPIQAATAQQKTSNKKNLPMMKSRSILGCDQMGIETLVSMLNSGESDSEKEDIQQQTQVQQQQQQIMPAPPPLPTVVKNNDASRIRMLRKTVSFQEDDSQLQTSASAVNGKDPFNFRRNSVAVPFAGRIRNTRSLFGQEICNLYMNTNTNSNNNNNNNYGINGGQQQQMNEEINKSENENDLNSSNQPQEEMKEKPKAKKSNDDNASNEKKSQDTPTTEPRELECWRLYEKMKKTGLNISYDTILRGILKPSELRLLEKQKKLLGDIEEKPFERFDEP